MYNRNDRHACISAGRLRTVQKGMTAVKYPPAYIRTLLSYRTGSSHCFKVSPLDKAPVITEGVKDMAELCEAYWLIDKIVSVQMTEPYSKEYFQVWRLVMKEDHKATLTCDDGNDKVISTEEINYTDFPLSEGVTLYMTNDVIMLPTEY